MIYLAILLGLYFLSHDTDLASAAVIILIVLIFVSDPEYILPALIYGAGIALPIILVVALVKHKKP